jgi:GntR family transcriptional regulator
MSKPVHMSIRDDLRMRLAAGEWGAGDRLPSETDLASRYGVARMTVRQAIGSLASEGMVVRRQGLGTFAADRPGVRQGGGLLSFTEEMRSQGRVVATKMVRAAVEEPPAAAREALQLGSCTAAVTVARLRLLDGHPAVVQNSWLPCARFAGLDAEPLLSGSLYTTLERRYGVRIVRARQQVTAGVASDGEAGLLDLRPGSPVLRITRTTYDSSNRVVEYAMNAMSPGIPIETILERSPARGAGPASHPPAGLPPAIHPPGGPAALGPAQRTLRNQIEDGASAASGAGTSSG